MDESAELYFIFKTYPKLFLKLNKWTDVVTALPKISPVKSLNVLMQRPWEGIETVALQRGFLVFLDSLVPIFFAGFVFLFRDLKCV